MLDIFISLVSTAGKIGKVTAASLYPNDLIVIELEEGGKLHTLTYNTIMESGNNEDS